ncbi:RNA polymerase sigma factor [uncultured Dysosmobacter sp.]|uniref:RNA polymerase sigma factor n=1 Tax=uncultured Dysosmobacter sp. TaxID=2591384 RepID=UPI00260C2DFA|nr:sigma-70 family RNA polymerase sigma factor [uncultured Dysosmobacter sp.]
MIPADTADAVDRYGAVVYRMACAQTRSRQDADDIFQDVFLRYHRSAPVFESEEHRKAWLLRVTVNRARSLFTAPWRQRAVPLEDVYACTDPEASAVDMALARLSGKYRSVIHLYYYEGYGTDEIAEILNRPPSTVRAQLTRARQKLKELLKEEL